MRHILSICYRVILRHLVSAFSYQIKKWEHFFAFYTQIVRTTIWYIFDSLSDFYRIPMLSKRLIHILQLTSPSKSLIVILITPNATTLQRELVNRNKFDKSKSIKQLPYLLSIVHLKHQYVCNGTSVQSPWQPISRKFSLVFFSLLRFVLYRVSQHSTATKIMEQSVFIMISNYSTALGFSKKHF